MKKNQLRINRITILFSLTALLLFPFISNAQLKVVSTSGNVGVGITAPSTKLHLYTTDGIGAGMWVQKIEDGSSDGALKIGTGTSGNGAIQSYRISTGAVDKLILNSAGGNVGIGTTAPASKLDVQGSSATDIRVTSTTGTNQTFFRAVNTAGTFYMGLNNSVGNALSNATLPYAACFNHSGAYPINFAIQSKDVMTMLANGRVGIGTASPSSSFILDVQGAGATGTINASGAVYASGSLLTSDQQFKINVDSLESALTIIRLLKPKAYYFDTLNFNGEGKFNFSSAKQHGFVAQDVETILPELVSVVVKPAIIDTLGNTIKPSYAYRALNYIGFISILTKGIQELQFKNDSLQSKVNNQDSINASLQNSLNELMTKTNNQDLTNSIFQDQLNQLQTTINNCCSIGRSTQPPTNTQLQSSIKEIDVRLNDAQTIVLEQNVPNPFAEQTAINYSLPDNTVKAQMLFYNAQGKLIQSTELTQKGKGTLNVFASDLSSGIYTYTLVVEGKIIETRKMVKQ